MNNPAAYNLVVLSNNGATVRSSDSVPSVFLVSIGDSGFVHSIAGFKTGDRIIRPNGIDAVVADQSSFSDGKVSLQFAVDGVVTKIVLTGLSSAQDGNVFSPSDLNSLFGNGAYGMQTAVDVLRGAESSVGRAVEGGTNSDFIKGTMGSDTLFGGLGNDLIDGSGGTDIAVYTYPRSFYTVDTTAKIWSVRDRLLSEDSDLLVSVERIKFRDVSLAFDLNGNAGIVAKIIGAVFGKTAVLNPGMIGIGLYFIESQGLSNIELIDLAVQARFGRMPTSAEIVDLLYFNLVGVPPSDNIREIFTGMVDRKEVSIPFLGLMAAETELNKVNVNLVGLSTEGLSFIPF